MKKLTYLLTLFIFLSTSVQAVDVAPRISDREIIESLTELKAGQKAINQRFESLEKGIEQRFKGIDQRFDFISHLMLIMLAGIFGLIGFIIWDRKTALIPFWKRNLKPLKETYNTI